MRLLFISNHLLFKDSRFGGAKRLFSFAQELEKMCDLHLLCVDMGKEKKTFDQSPPSFKNLCCIPAENTSAWSRFRYDHRNTLRKHRSRILTFIAGEPFDAIFLAYPYSLTFLRLKEVRNHPNIIYQEDDVFLLQIKNAMKASASLPHKFIHHLRFLLVSRFYKFCSNYVNKVVAISPEEKNILKRYFPGKKIDIITYGLDLDGYPFLPLPNKNTLGFIGNFKHTPNIDALTYLLEAVYPAIKVDFPAIRLFIAGMHIPETIKNKHRHDTSIDWHENIDNIQSFYEQIDIFINPIVSGKGLRTKLIEAAGFGRPIISSALGAEGLSEFHIPIAETPEQFTRALRMLRNKGTLEQFRTNNRTAVEQMFSSSRVAQNLYDFFQSQD